MDVFEFPPPVSLPKREQGIYQLLLEIVRLCKEERRPHSENSLAKYLREAVAIFDSKIARKSLDVTKPRLQTEKLIHKAQRRVGVPQTRFRFRKPHRDSGKMNLVPMEFFEQIISKNLPAPGSSNNALAKLLVIISLYTGRRSSDFADVKIRNFSVTDQFFELTIPTTKSKAVKKIRLPLHRLIVPSLREYSRQTIQLLTENFSPDQSIHEIFTGKTLKSGVGRPDSSKIREFEAASIGHEIQRTHAFRHAFATWAPVAAMLAWNSDICCHPDIFPWVGGSEFFCPEMLAEWRKMTAFPAADPFPVIAQILGHTSPRELQSTYCVSWPVQLRIAAIRAKAELKSANYCPHYS